MADTNRWLARLCWALVVLTIISAIAQIGLATGTLIPFPNVDESASLPDRLVQIRSGDQATYGLVAVANLASVGVYLIVGLLGPVLRSLIAPSSARDLMATLFVITAAVGIAGQLVNLGTAQAATFGYCDCGFKTEEVIAQNYALNVGFQIQFWLTLFAVTAVGVGAAIAGRLLDISSAWRWLSYAIAALLLLAAVVRIAAAFFFIDAFDPFQVTDVIVGLTAGILVPIWAVMLARWARRTPTMAAQEMAA